MQNPPMPSAGRPLRTSHLGHRLGLACLLALPALGASSAAGAVSIDAGDYVAAPAGTDLFLLYAQHAESKGLYSNGHKVDGDARLNVDVLMPRYVKFIEVGGHTLDLQVLLPWVRLEGGGSTAALGSASGMGDVILVSTLWLVEDKQARTYFGITPYLYLPTGSYDKNRALNPGENRWKGDLQAVVSQGWGERWTTELSFDVMAHGKNDDYAGGATMKQKPIFDTQGFLRYHFNPANEVSLKLRYQSGGETRVNGVDQDDALGTWSALATYSRALPGNTQLLVQAGRDISVDNGFREESRVQLRFLKAF